MPYYVHPVDKDPVEGARVCFFSITAARAAKQNGETVTFVANDDELDKWQVREQRRFEDGTYIEVPWPDYHHLESGYVVRHYAHLSLKFAGRVAFTKSIEHGTVDRQTVMRPGRYLEQFFGDYDSSDRARWVGIVSSLKSELKIARTPDEIEQVYVNGPGSCMSHSADSYSSREHPVRVYGNSDLAVAYMGDINEATGRSVVWPDKKIHGRIYGSESVMMALLSQAGYEEAFGQSEWIGAKLRCVENDDGSYVMPYLDIADTVNIHRVDGQRWCVVAGCDGDLSARQTDGTTGRPNCCERCNASIDEDECYCEGCLDASSICPDCDERNWDDNRDGYCDSCSESYSSCDHCDEYVHNDNIYYLDSQEINLCESCYENTASCEVCEEHFLEAAYPRAVRTQRASTNLVNRVCHRCEQDGAFICAGCDTGVKGGEVCEECTEKECEQGDREQEVVTCAS